MPFYSRGVFGSKTYATFSSWVASGLYTAVCLLPVDVVVVNLVCVNLAGARGYAFGDRVKLTDSLSTYLSNNYGASVFLDATKKIVSVRIGTAGLVLRDNFSAGVVTTTNADFSLEVVAFGK